VQRSSSGCGQSRQLPAAAACVDGVFLFAALPMYGSFPPNTAQPLIRIYKWLERQVIDIYSGLLHRGKIQPSYIKISMKNVDGAILSASVHQFVSGHTRHLTRLELEAFEAVK
jgi:hypothetical protein